MKKAINQGILKIGEKELDCAVLEDGTRVISRNAIFRAFGRTKRGRAKYEVRVPNMPSFLDAKNLLPHISEELRSGLISIEYRNIKGKPTTGYNATILPLICDAYLAAREAGELTKKQLPLAAVSEVLVRSFSKIGIIALIDEVTGYQYVRDRDELNKILEAYISKELLPWTRRFPNEFYQQLFRVWGWKYSPLSVKRPQYVGKLTNKLIYEKLPPGVLDELKRKNPVVEAGRRKHKHHQFLTEDVGNPHLEKQLVSVTTLLRVSPNRRNFERLFERAFPSSKPQLALPFPEVEEKEIINELG